MAKAERGQMCFSIKIIPHKRHNTAPPPQWSPKGAPPPQPQWSPHRCPSTSNSVVPQRCPSAPKWCSVLRLLDLILDTQTTIKCQLTYRYACKITPQVGGWFCMGMKSKTFRKFRGYVYLGWYDFHISFFPYYFVKIMQQKQLFSLIFL